jgi:murein DD-endopeptidase MepM/ murein hydrolase activator NlpD
LRKSVSPRPFANGAPARARRLSLNPLLFYGGFAALLATNALTLAGLFMAPDIAKLVAGNTDATLAAYEDRIFELRLEVDRLQSRHYAQAGDINLQLQDLAQTQELLLEQHQYVRQLAERAAALGIEAGTAPAPAAPPVLAGARSNDPAAEVAEAAASVDRMMTESRLALAALSDEATTRTDAIMDTLANVGIRPKLPSFASEDGVGGPLLPPVEGAESSGLVDDANAVAEALERYRAARGAAALAPVHKPIRVATRTSSTFGNRKDPFTGRLAFHSGIDYAAPRDSTVLSAGAGTVSFVGQISGYGNVVEIDHGNGLVTRYGHLNSFIAKEGQRVATGTPIARVGSTGRSTGPHLHFEVRRSDTAVDPARYLKAGQALQKILAG